MEIFRTGNTGLFTRTYKNLPRESVTEADASMLFSRITAYIRETPGVRIVEDVRFEVLGRKLLYDRTVRTEEGTAGVRYEAGLQQKKGASKCSGVAEK